MTKQTKQTTKPTGTADSMPKAAGEPLSAAEKTAAQVVRRTNETVRHLAEANGWTETADKQAATLSALQGPFVEAASHVFGRYVEGMAELNREMTRFVAERLRYDAEFGHALTGCHSFAQAAEMQQEWVRKATEDYMTEAKRLGEIGQKVVAETTQRPST
ncbi:MAG: phasin family protein [Alphaproteobacteria bacterium]|nr:phasin family protein [Alphaproteobacteria bacterium]